MSDANRSDDGNAQETPPDLYAARVTGNSETLAKLRKEFDLDVGCRGPHFEKNADGTGTMAIYATEQRLRELRAAGYKVEAGENVSEVGRQRQKEVGDGDRFMEGRIAPRGLGEKPGTRQKRGPKS